MKTTNKKVLKLMIISLIIISVCTTHVFAADVKSEMKNLSSWMLNSENSGFDFSDTSYLDTNICWTVLALAKANSENYKEFGDYINSVVESGFDTMFPSNLALVYLSAEAYGLNTENIGGHNILSALKCVDYSTQVYLSSLYFPLIALNYKQDNSSDNVKSTIVSTILQAQQEDGGFPYCSVDTGWGVYSDVDTTSFVIQSLSDYKDDAEVSAAIEKALQYIETQKFEDGSYGYVAYSSPSAESTAQAVIAKLLLGIDCDDSIDALKSYINYETGAAKNYLSEDDIMSSYQVLLALAEVDDAANGGNGIYKYSEPKVEDSTTQAGNPTETITTEKDESTVETTQNIQPTTATDKKVDIPKTGSKNCLTAFVSMAMISGAALYVLGKKNEE